MIKKEYRHLEKPAENREEAIARLDDIIHLLRRECPWDREQDHRSLRSCLIEEAYEVVEAIDEEDDDNLREELGDVLLQVVFHASLSAEENRFDLTDVINDECEKMIRRHPHVFLDEEAKTVDKVLEKWENIKVKEYDSVSYTDRLKSVPNAFPALIYASKVQKKAAQAGFDWEQVDGALDKVTEEAKELADAHGKSDPQAIFDELGDLLFSIVNVARFLTVDPEEALRMASRKFVARFAQMEELAEKEGMSLDRMDLQDMDVLWETVKSRNDE